MKFKKKTMIILKQTGMKNQLLFRSFVLLKIQSKKKINRGTTD